MMSFQGLASRVIAGEKLTRAQALAILTTDDQQVPALLDHAWQVRYHFHGKRVNIQVLSNAKSGLCSEDCHYCAQSRVSQAEITCYPLKQHDTLVREAKAAHSQAADRFCMGLSGRTLNKSEVDRLCTTIRAIKAATDGKGPDVIYDPVGGDFAEPAFRSIAWRGRYLVVGFASGPIPALPFNLALLKGASIVGVFWGDFAKREPKANAAMMGELAQWYAQGKIKPVIDRTMPMAELPAAYAHMGSRGVMGKLVMVN